MLAAMRARDRSFDGVFFTAVRTTGIFCLPSCGAKTPLPKNVTFHATARDALLAGYRPCKRCRPLAPVGTAPEWLAPLLAAVEDDPSRRWTDADLREHGLDPGRVRRWFHAHHRMTFHAYLRARRLGLALGRLQHGDDLTRTALDHGYESLSGFRDAFSRVFGDAPGRSRDRARCLVSTRIPTPLGPMLAVAHDDGLCLLEFTDRRMLERQLRTVQRRLDAHIVPGDHPLLDRVAGELAEYFDGDRRVFDVPVLTPGTPFQESVWAELLRIPSGETRSYDALARAIGRPGSQRAVGRANGDNRVAILVPCHRVVGADGRLTGYGGGLWRKRALLDLER